MQLNKMEAPATSLTPKPALVLGLGFLLGLSLLLVACGDNTSTAQTGSPTLAPTTASAAATTVAATTAALTTTAANVTTVAATSPAAATTSVATTTAPLTATTAAIASGSKPSIALSSDSIEIGQKLNIIGQGFPPNGWVTVEFKPEGDTATRGVASLALADATGKCNTDLILSSYGDGSPIKAGKNTILVITQDTKLQATTSVNLLPKPETQPVK